MIVAKKSLYPSVDRLAWQMQPLVCSTFLLSNIYLSSPAGSADVDVFLVPFISLGITQPFDVHSGFLAAYNDVADVVLTTVKAQLTNFPKYAVVVTG
jgi:hypothetical protein